MRTYSVYRNPGQNNDHEIFVEESFCWGAFFFSVFWALYFRAWSVFGVVLLVLGSLYGAWSGGVFPGHICLLFGTVLSALLGWQASDFRGKHLEYKGFIMVAIVLGRDRDTAEARFFSRQALA